MLPAQQSLKPGNFSRSQIHNRLIIIAEGVETIEQVALLKKLHCKYGQGYYFSKPLSAEGTKALLTGDLAWQAYQPSK